MAYAQPAPASDLSQADRAQLQHAVELARMLVRHLGVDGAARTCRENHWDGVLAEVMNQARTTTTA